MLDDMFDVMLDDMTDGITDDMLDAIGKYSACLWLVKIYFFVQCLSEWVPA